MSHTDAHANSSLPTMSRGFSIVPSQVVHIDAHGRARLVTTWAGLTWNYTMPARPRRCDLSPCADIGARGAMSVRNAHRACRKWATSNNGRMRALFAGIVGDDRMEGARPPPKSQDRRALLHNRARSFE